MMFRLLLISVFLCFGMVKAQQQPQFTMFNNTASMYNPGLTGLEYQHFGALTYRHQWVGFGGAPQSTAWLYETNQLPIHGGLGTNGYLDKLGFESNLGLNLQYAYHINLKEAQKLSIGLATGFHRKTLEADWVSIDPNDPAIPPNGSSSAVNFNFGLVYRVRELLVGLSATQITESLFGFGQSRISASRHYYLYSRYQIDLGTSSSIQPSFLLKTDLASTQFELNLRYILMNTYWAGVSYRHEDAVCFMMGVDVLKKYRIGCAYDMTISDLANYSQGSIEFVLAVLINRVSYRQFSPVGSPDF